MERTLTDDPSELPTDWWATADVLRYLESVGRPITESTWSTYVSRGQAPAPGRRFGGFPVWRPADVKAWHESSQGPGRPRRT